MLDELNPKSVLVYGRMPDNIFTEFKHRTQFINYPDWISEKKNAPAHINRCKICLTAYKRSIIL